MKTCQRHQVYILPTVDDKNFLESNPSLSIRETKSKQSLYHGENLGDRLFRHKHYPLGTRKMTFEYIKYSFQDYYILKQIHTYLFY